MPKRRNSIEPPSVTDTSGRQLVLAMGARKENGTYRVLLIF